MNTAPDSERTATAPPAPARDLARHLKGTNINEVSLLATDYLNHFNEIVMILDLIPDMPEMLDEARAWRPKGYKEHFRDSSFSDKELAIAAYDHAPAEYRRMFEDTVSCMNRLVELSLARIAAAAAAGHGEATALAAALASRDLQKLMGVVSAVINGAKPTMGQDEIDALLQS